MSITIENLEKYRADAKLSGHAVVYGGNGGIGAEVVAAIVAQGVQAVSFTYNRNKVEAEAVAKSLTDLGIKVYFDSINLSDDSVVNNFLEAAVQSTGLEISLAVHAVGVSPNKHLREQTLETVSDRYDDIGWREVFDVNVFGCMVSCRAVLMRMESKGITNGAVVIITSTNGENSPSSMSTHYDAAKAAQKVMMQGLAECFTLTAHVNGVAPGWMDTKMNDTLPPEMRAREEAKIWLGKFGHPRLVAAPIAFFLSPAASFIRGQNILIDGGYPKHD
jgi:NAD(P)-dependent dehydrogenase (short-subunit alcohol dehydrogenase family)